jgi:hypothetical protein
VPGELNNVTTANAYTRDTTRQAPRSTRVRLIVRNASIYYQLGYGGRAGAVNFDEEPERFLPPGTYGLDESEKPFDGFRVRSATPGVPAQVTADCVTEQRNG